MDNMERMSLEGEIRRLADERNKLIEENSLMRCKITGIISVLRKIGKDLMKLSKSFDEMADELSKTEKK